MKDATVVLTGATGGLGSATARALASSGAHVLALARRSERLERVLSDINTTEGECTLVPVDLSEPESIREAADAIAESTDQVDALVNTAAIFSRQRRLNSNGVEMMLATNQLGPFLLTNLLRDLFSPSGRVITVSAPSTSKVDFDKLQSAEAFKPLSVFGATKAANLLFAFELSRRASHRDVHSNAFHPGLLRSNLMKEAPAPIRLLTRIASRAPERAGDALAELALSPDYSETTGEFFKLLKRIDPPAGSTDVASQHDAWERSAELVGLTPDQSF